MQNYTCNFVLTNRSVYFLVAEKNHGVGFWKPVDPTAICRWQRPSRRHLCSTLFLTFWQLWVPDKMAKKVPPAAQSQPEVSRVSRFKTRRIVSLLTTGLALVVIVCLVTGISVVGRTGLSRDSTDPLFDAFVAESEATGESSGIVKRAPQTRFDRPGFSLSGKIKVRRRRSEDHKRSSATPKNQIYPGLKMGSKYLQS